MFGKIFKKKAPPSKRPTSDLLRNVVTRTNQKKDLRGWAEFVKGFAVDRHRNKADRQRIFFEVMAFRDSTLGIGREAAQ